VIALACRLYSANSYICCIIAGIIKKVDTTNRAMDQTLNQAFKDMDALMMKAADMVLEHRK
jgi:hypothetical protein